MLSKCTHTLSKVNNLSNISNIAKKHVIFNHVDKKLDKYFVSHTLSSSFLYSSFLDLVSLSLRISLKERRRTRSNKNHSLFVSPSACDARVRKFHAQNKKGKVE